MTQDRENTPKTEGIDLDLLPASVRDFILLNKEMAGIETGRMKRFVKEGHAPGDAEKKNEKTFNALKRLLQNPAYAQLYYEAGDAIRRAEEATERARQKLKHLANDAAERLKEIRESAAQLRDGTKVYKSVADDHLYTEDGRDVTALAASVTGLSAGSPSREDLAKAKASGDGIAARLEAVESFQRDMIDPAKERHGDTEHPQMADELTNVIEAMKNPQSADIRAELAAQDMTKGPAVDAKNAAQRSAAEEFSEAFRLKTPDLCAKFTNACSGSGVNERGPYGPQATALPAGNPKNN